MIDFDLIKNAQLRLLVAASESINSLPEDQAQAMVERIAQLPAEGEQAMIKALTDEQNQILKAKRARGITPEMEQQQLEQNMQKIVAIQKDFEHVVRQENEKLEIDASEKAAEDILKKI